MSSADRHTSHMPCLSTCSSSAQSAHMHIHSPREHAWLKGQQGSSRLLWYVKITCHPSVMSHPLQHLSLGASARSLSPTSLFRRPLPHSPDRWYRIHIPAHIHSGVSDPLKSASPSGYESQFIQADDFELRRIELDRNLGTDLHQTPEKILGDDNQILSQKIRMKPEKLVSRSSSNHRHTPIMIQLNALQTRILKMENYEKCWLHRCMCMGEEKIMVLLTNPQLREKTRSRSDTEGRDKCKSYSS